jgi:glycosyltransferase involved in cell wall biosynthesis
MNLLVFNLATDADDPLLSFATGWINRLAAHYERIDVVTMRAGRLTTAPNVCVHSVGKEKGYGEARRAVEFYTVLVRLLRERRYAACFAHMMPLFALMGAPLLRGVPITLWYTHRQPHTILRLATAVSYRVVTAAATSFPLQTPKLRVIGHGIDTDFFSPDPAEADLSAAPRIIVHVARLMPIKHQATLIRALPDVPDAQAVFVGDVPPGVDASYRRELETLARDLGVAERVTFAGNQPAESVRGWNRRAAVALNLSPIGLFDKAALEGMAVGVPTIVGSTAFDDVIADPSMRLDDLEDAAGLAARLRDLLALTEQERHRLGMIGRRQVVKAHSLDGLITRLVSVLKTGEAA